MVEALIGFTQGSSTAAAGIAFLGVPGVLVVCSNGNDTGVTSWAWALVDVPSASSLSKTTGASSTFSFTPDVPGCYRVHLTVTDASGNTDTDIRNIAIPLPNGLIIPPFQGFPFPITTIGIGNKPDELNFGLQSRGWAGGSDTSAACMGDALVRRVDALAGTRYIFNGVASGLVLLGTVYTCDPSVITTIMVHADAVCADTSNDHSSGCSYLAVCKYGLTGTVISETSTPASSLLSSAFVGTALNLYASNPTSDTAFHWIVTVRHVDTVTTPLAP